MSVFVDCNIIIDWLSDRKPHSEYAKRFLNLVEEGVCNAVVSPLVLTNVYYIVRKLKNRKVAQSLMIDISNLFEVCSVTKEDIDQATAIAKGDFEDVVHYQTAIRTKVEAIITRNKKDFPQGKIKILTAKEYLEKRQYK